MTLSRISAYCTIFTASIVVSSVGYNFSSLSEVGGGGFLSMQNNTGQIDDILLDEYS